MSGINLETLISFNESHEKNELISPKATPTGRDVLLLTGSGLDHFTIAREVGALINENKGKPGNLYTILTTVQWLKKDAHSEYSNMSNIRWITELFENLFSGIIGTQLGNAATEWEKIETDLKQRLVPEASLANIINQLEWGEQVEVTAVNDDEVDYSKNRVKITDLEKLVEATTPYESEGSPRLTIHLSRQTVDNAVTIERNLKSKMRVQSGEGPAKQRRLRIVVSAESQVDINEAIENKLKTKLQQLENKKILDKQRNTIKYNDIDTVIKWAHRETGTTLVVFGSQKTETYINKFDPQQLAPLLVKTQMQNRNLFIVVTSPEELKQVHQTYMHLFGDTSSAAVTVLFANEDNGFIPEEVDKYAVNYKTGPLNREEAQSLKQLFAARHEEKGFKYYETRTRLDSTWPN